MKPNGRVALPPTEVVGRCDCKYAPNGEVSVRGSENGSGCPELMSIALILEVLTPFEWERALKRVEKKGHILRRGM